MRDRALGKAPPDAVSHTLRTGGQQASIARRLFSKRLEGVGRGAPSDLPDASATLIAILPANLWESFVSVYPLSCPPLQVAGK